MRTRVLTIASITTSVLLLVSGCGSGPADVHKSPDNASAIPSNPAEDFSDLRTTWPENGQKYDDVRDPATVYAKFSKADVKKATAMAVDMTKSYAYDEMLFNTPRPEGAEQVRQIADGRFTSVLTKKWNGYVDLVSKRPYDYKADKKTTAAQGAIMTLTFWGSFANPKPTKNDVMYQKSASLVDAGPSVINPAISDVIIWRDTEAKWADTLLVRVNSAATIRFTWGGKRARWGSMRETTFEFKKVGGKMLVDGWYGNADSSGSKPYLETTTS